MSGCPPTNAAPYGHGSFPALSPWGRGAVLPSLTSLSTAARSIPGWCRAIPLGKAGLSHQGLDQHMAGDATSSGWRKLLTASAGKISETGSKVSVALQEQSRHAQLMAQILPIRTVTPKHLSCLPLFFSPWILQLQLYLPCLLPLNSMSLERERNSTGKKRRISRKGMWVRTRESGGGLSKGSKGGLLHSQLVELGQLLRGRRDIRAKKVIVIEYNKSH